MTDSILSPGAGIAVGSVEVSASEETPPAPSVPTLTRRWSDEEKMRIVSDSFRSRASVAAIVQRHGVSDTTLTKWQRRAREGTLPGAQVGKSAPSFVPVMVADSAWSEQKVT